MPVIVFLVKSDLPLQLLAPYLNLFLPKDKPILHVGCGSSNLTAAIFDVLQAYYLSEVVPNSSLEVEVDQIVSHPIDQ